jgi:hypothetical protein
MHANDERVVVMTHDIVLIFILVCGHSVANLFPDYSSWKKYTADGSYVRAARHAERVERGADFQPAQP